MKSLAARPTRSRRLLSVLVTASLCGCQSLGPYALRDGESPAIETAKMLSGVPVNNLRQQANTAEKKIVAEAMDALRTNDLAKASQLFNAALKLRISSSELHTLNALTYHLMALAGDSSRYEMAEEGYKVALRFDPTNAVAEYQLGLCYLDQRKFSQAQQHLARAAVANSNDPEILYDLAVASYYARDPRIAEGALVRLAKISPERAHSAEVYRALALTRAALNDMPAAMSTLDDMRKSIKAEEFSVLEQRINDWGGFYRTASTSMKLAQFAPRGGGFAAPQPEGGYAPPAPAAVPPGQPVPAGAQQPGAFVDEKMVAVDVVLIGTQDDSRESYGINLLNGLRLQFGDSLSGAPAASFTTESVRDRIDPTLNTETFTVTRSMRVPSITYSLNIANAFNGNNEVIAKPSLVALAGQTSEFFSGTEISAAAVSGGAGDSVTVQKEVGIKLSVRPDFLPSGKIRLQVAAQRTFLTDPSSSVVFQFRLDTTKTNVNANVVLKYGETLILSGLIERETSASNNGVPVLRDVPGLNLLFAERGTREFRKSILILLTPRRPTYGAQAPEDRQAVLDSLSDYEKSISSLENRHKDWFRPLSNFEAIRRTLDRSEVYREFRSGDLKAERWQMRTSHLKRVSATLDHLFL